MTRNTPYFKPEKNKILFLLGFIYLAFSPLAFGQNKKFVVYFKDKKGGNPYSLSNPSAFLSPRAIQRRNTQNLALDSSDLPVSPAYLTGLSQAGATVLYPLRWLNGAIIDCPATSIPSIEALPFVIFSKALNSKIKNPSSKKWNKDGIQSILSLEYGLSENQNSMLGIDSMHAFGFHGEGKLIAVMDAGFQNVNNHVAFSHLFTANKILGVKDFVTGDGEVYTDHWHGAAVLSNMAAKMPGQLYGGAFEANYFLMRTEDAATENEIECAYWVAGLEMADSIGADVVNSSLGYTTFDTPSLDYNYNSLDGNTSLASRAAKLAAGKGMVVVTSAGNEGNNNSWGGWISVPADAENIITAGSVNDQLNYSTFSGKGPTADGRIKPDLVARGAATIVINAFSNDAITSSNGTSFSAPLISGLVAGYWQAHPSLTALQIIQNLKLSASNKTNPNNQIGWGVPSFVQAHILAGARPRMSFPFNINIYPNPNSLRELTIEFVESSVVGMAKVELWDAKGKKVASESLSYSQAQEKNQIKLDHLPVGMYHLILEIGGKTYKEKVFLH
jgi:hypothetical protein